MEFDMTDAKNKPPHPKNPDIPRLIGASLDGSRYAVWHQDYSVTQRDRAWYVIEEKYAANQAEFDELCVMWGIEPVKRKLLKRS
jgi:hypothetical protein